MCFLHKVVKTQRSVLQHMKKQAQACLAVKEETSEEQREPDRHFIEISMFVVQQNLINSGYFSFPSEHRALCNDLHCVFTLYALLEY